MNGKFKKKEGHKMVSFESSDPGLDHSCAP